MKVALFIHCFFPEHFYGTETYTLQIAQNLQALGHEVMVVAGVFQGEPRRAAPITRYQHDGVPVIALDKNFEPHSRIRETYWQEAMRPHLRAVLAELRPDIVHVTHLVNHTAVLLEEIKAAGYPVVATLTDFFGFCYNNKLEAADGGLCAGPSAFRMNCIACHMKAAADAGDPKALLGGWLVPGSRSAALAMRLSHAVGWPRMLGAESIVPDIVERPGILRSAYQAYDAMIAPTLFLRDAYARNGFDAQRLHLSRFGVDLARVPKSRRSAGGPLTVGFIGQIAPHKGVDLLVCAARAMPPGSIRLNIHGPEDQYPAYMERLRQIAGTETTFFGPFPSPRVSEVLAEMDILAIPSTWYENSPLVLLNALATHTPVLVSDVQGLTEFISEGQDGWSFRRGDGADLARVLAGLVADPDRVRRASEETQYDRTTRSMAEDVARIYDDVTKARAASGRTH